MISHSGFISISLMTIKVEYLTCLLTSWIATLVSGMFKSSIYFGSICFRY